MSKPLTYQVIMRARDIIADKHHWTQGTQASTKNGRPTRPNDERASRFCATGAMIRAGFELTSDLPQARLLTESACSALCPTVINDACDPLDAVQMINDKHRTGHAAVLKLFDDYLSVH
jgi:hypothetical protein